MSLRCPKHRDRRRACRMAALLWLCAGWLCAMCLCALPAARAGARAGLGGFRWSSITPQANTLNSVAAPLPGTNGIGLMAAGDATTFLYRRALLSTLGDAWLFGRGRPIRQDVDYRGVAVMRRDNLVALVGDDGVALVGNGFRMEPNQLAKTALNAAGWMGFKDFSRLAVVGDAGAAFYWDSNAGQFAPAAVDTSIPTPDLLALSFPPSDTPGVGFAAGRVVTPNGAFGVVLRTEDGGRSWRALSGLPAVQAWRDVSFVSPTYGFALGVRDGLGVVLRTIDGGLKWDVVNTVDGSMRAIAAFDAERLVLVGDAGIMAGVVGQLTPRPEPVENLTVPIVLNDVDVAGPEAWAVGERGVIFYSADYGATWFAFGRSRILRDETLRPLYALQYLSDTDVVAAGARGALLRSLDGGDTFTPMASPTDADILALASPGARNAGAGAFSDAPGVAVGARRTVLAFDPTAGAWVTKATVPGVDYTDAALLDTAAGVRAWAVGDGGTIVSNLAGSPLWTVQKTGTLRRLNAVAAARSSTGLMLLAVGDAGTLLRSRDGLNWTPVTNLPTPMAAVNLRGVLLRTPAVGFVVGDGGLIARTLDSGSSWEVIQTASTADLYTVAAVPTSLGNEVWAAGAHQAVLYSPDNGGTWTTLPAPVAGTTVPDFIYRAVQPVEPGHVFLAGEQGHLLEKIPGVGQWVERDPGTNDTYYALRMPDASRGMAVSADKAGTPRVSFTLEGWLKSYNAALPAGTPRLLGGDVLGSDTIVVGEGGTILRTGGAFTSGVRYRSETPAIRAVVSPQAGEYIAAGDTGLLVRSADNGATWDEIPFQNPFGPDVQFRALAFQAPDATGVAVGYLAGKVPGGNVPVLFRTLDSGKSWDVFTPDVGLEASGIHALAAFSGMLLAAADNGAVYLFDGARWSVQRPIPGFTGAWNALSATDARWYVVGDFGRAARFPDALGRPQWQPLNTGTRNNLQSINGPPPAGSGGSMSSGPFVGADGAYSGGDGFSGGGVSGGGESLRDDIRGVCMDPPGVFTTDSGGVALFGDVNRDTLVNITDEKTVLRCISGQSLPDEPTMFFGDMDPPSPAVDALPGDGVLDIADVTRLWRTAMGL